LLADSAAVVQVGQEERIDSVFLFKQLRLDKAVAGESAAGMNMSSGLAGRFHS
jgi:2-methylaconitate cis-trans-isomerase PrpF